MNAWLGSDEWLLALLASSSAKAALVFAAGATAALALTRRSAASRHLAWTLACAGALVLPALALVVPAWQVAPPALWSAPQGPTASAAAPEAAAAAASGSPEDVLDAVQLALAARIADPGHEAAPTEAVPGQLALARLQPVAQTEEPLMIAAPVSPAWSFAWLLPVWALGALVASLPVLIGSYSLVRLARGLEPVTDRATLALARRLCAQLGLGRSVRLLQTHLRTIPMTWGIVRPVILLPADSAQWSEERLTTALLHELAHVARGDCLAQLVARAACALYWFNPLAWLALARVRVEQEQACDDLALERGIDRVAYADHLLEILAGRRLGRSPAIVALSMGTSARLEWRLRSILDASRIRRAPGRRAVGSAAAAAALLLLPLAALDPRADAEALGPVANASAASAAEPAAEPAPQPAPGDEKDKPQKADAGVEAEVLARVREAALKAPEESALREGAIKGILEALHDPYSEYYDQQRLSELERGTQGKLSGIGIELREKEGDIFVFSPLPDSPALKAGIRSGDVIEEVEGKPTKGQTLLEVVKRIAGPAGQPVRLKVRHSEGQIAELAVTRAVVNVPTVRGFRFNEGGKWDYRLDPAGIGYVRISQLTPATPQDLKEVLDQLAHDRLNGLILDLRNCPGGMMSAAVDTVKLFLSKGTIVAVRGRGDEPKAMVADEPAPFAELPIVVLIDGATASGAEIIAGALKHNDRAITIGSRTFGKGSIQTIVTLKESAGAIKLTSARYELAGGLSIDKEAGKTSWGIDPTDGYYVPVDDIEREAMLKKRQERERIGVPAPPPAKLTPEWLEGEQSDPQLAAALKAMHARTMRGSFEKTGRPLAEQTARIERLESARKRREALLEDLKKVDKELSELK